MKWALAILLVLAGSLYFFGLGRNDIVTDESSYMVRGMKMLDFDFGIQQPTPIEWVQSVPWWMKLSFHDHPPLFFLLENWSIALFGETAEAGRIPSVIAGLVSILFIFFIAKELYSPEVGLATAAIFAFTIDRVWISRVALQESLVIALMLVAAYAFLRSLRQSISISMVQSIDTDVKSKALVNRGWFLAAGALLGVAFLAKYTAFILAPIFLTILLIRRRDYFRTKEFIFSIILFLAVISPVLIYNIGLYKTFGHFDFQISYIVGEHVAAWKSAPGKEAIGSLGDRFRNYVPTMVKINSPVFLLLCALGLFTAAWQTLKRLSNRPSHIILFVFLAWTAALMLAIGPTYRFLAMLTPWLALFAGVFLVFLAERVFYFSPAAAKILFMVLLAGEAFYAYNSVIALTPVGRAPWTYAAIRSENNNWGFNQLEEFLKGELAGKRPAFAISFDYPVISKVLDDAISEDTANGLRPAPFAIVYNGNISMGAQLWIFLRRVVYHGWPIADADTYGKSLAENGPDYFKKLGVEKIYFINSTDATLLRVPETRPLTNAGNMLEQELLRKGIRPREIKNLRGEAAFRIYEFAP